MARCEAAGPWGMQGTIEDLMAKEAQQTLQKFLDFARHRCEERLDVNVRRAISSPQGNCAGMLPDRSRLPCSCQGALNEEDDEQFHDADTGIPRVVHIPTGTISHPKLLSYHLLQNSNGDRCCSNHRLDRRRVCRLAELLQEQTVSQFLRDLSSSVQSLAAETQLLRERCAHDAASTS